MNIYASSLKYAWPLMGNHENTDIGAFMASYLDLDLEEVTKKLQSAAWSSGDMDNASAAEFGWMGNPLGEKVPTDGLDTYHGEYKRGLEG